MIEAKENCSTPLIKKEKVIMTGEADPMIKDKKRLEMSGLEVYPIFLFNLLILLPLWLSLLVPLTVIFQGGAFLWNLMAKTLGLKKKKNKNLPTSEAASIVTKTTKTTKREYDLVIFGATGFTGSMAAVYIAKRYGTQFKWAIAGRRMSALQDLRTKLTLINPTLSSLPIIIADTTDKAALQKMVESTKVVISTAGPFAKYGSDLVAFCSQIGTHYCDITGETDWVRGMIDKNDEKARTSGARIVHFCGHDCVPWDLAVLECSKHLKAKGESLVEVNCYDEISSSPSGGTIATIFHALNNREKLITSLGYDPMVKDLLGAKSLNTFITENTKFLGYSDEYKSWIGPFLMAAVMANCIRRSNAINNYGLKLKYRESVVYSSFMAGFSTIIGLLVFGTALVLPPLKYALKTFVLPLPGQGPSESTMDAGFLKVTCMGKGSNGGRVRAVFYFPTDPGYRDTARMLVESGLVLALEGNRVKVEGGVWTPATCQGDLLTERLIASGSTLTVEAY